MRYLPDATKAKAADALTIEQYHIPSMVLMERAALSTVDILKQERIDTTSVLVVCGNGNNGGDGFAVARLLFLEGKQVTVWFIGEKEKLTEDARRQLEILQKIGLSPVNSLKKEEYSVIIDAVFGIGLSRSIQGLYSDIIEKLNQLSGTKVALDIPSGVDATNGKIHGTAFRADITVTFAFAKIGMILFPGYLYTGKIITADIGIIKESVERDMNTAYTLEKSDAVRMLPRRIPDSHKGSYGKVLIIAGSKGMSGAAYLSARACYQTGAGLVKIYTCEDNRSILQQLLPEAIVEPYTVVDTKTLQQLLHWADTVLIGPGFGTSQQAEEIFNYVMDNIQTPCVIDADGLNLLADNITRLNGKKQIILTPHLLELSRLLGLDIETVAADRRRLVKTFTAQYSIVCVSKDARTLVAEEGTQDYINTAGCSALAKAGSGDVLSGIITGLLAQGAALNTASVLGVYIHALTGDAAKEMYGSYSVSAGVLTDTIANVIKELEERYQYDRI